MRFWRVSGFGLKPAPEERSVMVLERVRLVWTSFAAWLENELKTHVLDVPGKQITFLIHAGSDYRYLRSFLYIP